MILLMKVRRWQKHLLKKGMASKAKNE
jgi:hypothetical protein